MEVENNIFYNTPLRHAQHENASPDRFPEAELIYDFVDQWSNSLLFDENQPEGIRAGEDLAPPERRGAKVGLLVADPMFDEAAMKLRIFRFKPGSPAVKLGIKPIDLSQVGSTLVQ